MSEPVILTFGAETRNVALARSLAAAMAARADLPLDQLEDVRLAVDEAVSQLILDAPESADVTCTFEVAGNSLQITATAPSRRGAVPSHDTFSWTVLAALVDTVDATVAAGHVTLALCITRAVPVGA